MAVVNVKRSRISGPYTVESADGVKFQRQLDVQYTVLVDDPAGDNELTAQSASGIPLYGQAFDTDYWLRARQFRIEKTGPTFYTVHVTYKSQSATDGSPLDDPPKVEWDFNDSEEEVNFQANGLPAVTPAGEPIQGLKMTTSDLVLRITRNLAYFDANLARALKNTVNADYVLGQPPGTALLRGLRASSVSTDDFTYWTVTAEIWFRRGAPHTTDAKAWYKRILNRGLYCLSDDHFVPCVDENGDPATHPMLLNDNGTQVWPPRDSGLANWLELQVYESANFAQLNLFG